MFNVIVLTHSCFLQLKTPGIFGNTPVTTRSLCAKLFKNYVDKNPDHNAPSIQSVSKLSLL